MHKKIIILVIFVFLLAPDCAWSLSSRLGQPKDDFLLIREVLSGFTVIANAKNADGRDKVLSDINEGMREQNLMPSLIWEKYNYVHSPYLDDILLVPMAFEGGRQTYIVICEPGQEELIIGEDAKIRRKIPVPKGFRGKDYHSSIRDRNILIVEEERVRFFYGTLRGLIVQTSRRGTLGRTLVASYDTAVEYTDASARGHMRSAIKETRNVFQPITKVKDDLEHRHIDIPETENCGVGYGVVLEYWGDKVLQGFSGGLRRWSGVNYSKRHKSVSLNCLTEKSKRDFVILAGITRKLKWMDESWDDIEFLGRPLDSEEILAAMTERGTMLYLLDGTEITALNAFGRSA